MITFHPVTDNYAEVYSQLQTITEPKHIEFRLTEFIVYTGEDIPVPTSTPILTP